jgi:hypothetical protein
MFLFLTSHGGWVRANLVFVDRYEIPLESLPVVTQDGD